MQQRCVHKNGLHFTPASDRRVRSRWLGFNFYPRALPGTARQPASPARAHGAMPLLPATCGRSLGALPQIGVLQPAPLIAPGLGRGHPRLLQLPLRHLIIPGGEEAAGAATRLRAVTHLLCLTLEQHLREILSPRPLRSTSVLRQMQNIDL